MKGASGGHAAQVYPVVASQAGHCRRKRIAKRRGPRGLRAEQAGQNGNRRLCRCFAADIDGGGAGPVEAAH
ncbi:hypothetical protein D3C81_1655260 [compost metagenome]